MNKINVLSLLLAFSAAAFAEEANLVLPAALLNSPEVVAEMARASKQSAKLFAELQDEVDAENDLYVEVTGGASALQEYRFDYFSAEHYNCTLTVEYDSRARKATVKAPFNCQIE
jgi:hypothetical protein